MPVPMRWPGSTDAYGSWKTIWIRRARRSRSVRRAVRPERGLPSMVMVPAVGVSRPTSIRATVVFPEPDSPTRPRDLPGGRLRDTSSTATRLPGNSFDALRILDVTAQANRYRGCRETSAADIADTEEQTAATDNAR